MKFILFTSQVAGFVDNVMTIPLKKLIKYRHPLKFNLLLPLFTTTHKEYEWKMKDKQIGTRRRSMKDFLQSLFWEHEMAINFNLFCN
ncbi:CLUMA_CG012288, isoform A [Clunio marinus]|uniref:CLUMA_CG012288, isoform A n=1 Tax=Clunio marinus TaxID=568069 RepID=A0A1J1IGX8_9DIPT|nr:CLUMA_CG012288, isoform A [Clunio marinus]